MLVAILASGVLHGGLLLTVPLWGLDVSPAPVAQADRVLTIDLQSFVAPDVQSDAAAASGPIGLEEAAEEVDPTPEASDAEETATPIESAHPSPPDPPAAMGITQESSPAAEGQLNARPSLKAPPSVSQTTPDAKASVQPLSKPKPNRQTSPKTEPKAKAKAASPQPTAKPKPKPVSRSSGRKDRAPQKRSPFIGRDSKPGAVSSGTKPSARGASQAKSAGNGFLPLPKPRRAPSPRYPERARWEERTGATTVSFRIRSDGSVYDARIASSSGHRDLDQAALSTIARWLFKVDRSAPFGARYRYRFRFKLD